MSSDEHKDLIRELNFEFRLYQAAMDQFEEQAARCLGIHRTDLRCLELVERSRQMTPGELAREMELTTGAVTSLLDRLERAGYTRRVRDKQDRRRVLVALTRKAQRHAAQIWGPM